MSAASEKICKERKERREKMRRTREGERCFFGKSKVVKSSEDRLRANLPTKSQALYLCILDKTAMLNVDAMSLKIELGYKAEQLT